MSEEEQKYFKGLIGFTFDSDDIKYIEKIVDKKDKEIEKLNNIRNKAIEYINRTQMGEGYKKELNNILGDDKEWRNVFG